MRVYVYSTSRNAKWACDFEGFSLQDIDEILHYYGWKRITFWQYHYPRWFPIPQESNMPVKKLSGDTLNVVAFIVILLLIVVGSVGYRYYRATVQSDVYKREGINISPWECFTGAVPAERTVNLK